MKQYVKMKYTKFHDKHSITVFLVDCIHGSGDYINVHNTGKVLTFDYNDVYFISKETYMKELINQCDAISKNAKEYLNSLIPSVDNIKGGVKVEFEDQVCTVVELTIEGEEFFLLGGVDGCQHRCFTHQKLLKIDDFVASIDEYKLVE